MKRIVAICLLLSMCFAFCACGEARAASSSKDKDASTQFTLRNGIQFGDTVDEVKKKETSLEFRDEFDPSNPEYGHMLKYQGTIAGYDGTAAFEFGESGLKQMYYRFYTTSNPFSGDPDPEDIYKTIYESCSRQYGDELKSGEEFPVVGYAVDEALFKIENADAKMLKYNQWVVWDDNGIDGVKIDLVMFYRIEDFNGKIGMSYRETYILVSYTSFLQEDIKNFNNAIDNDF